MNVLRKMYRFAAAPDAINPGKQFEDLLTSLFLMAWGLSTRLRQDRRLRCLLRKPDKLTDEEYAAMKTHPSIGARALAAHPQSNLVRDAVHLHHERPDGNGYPFGSHGTDIPLIARIVGVADAYDAMNQGLRSFTMN